VTEAADVIAEARRESPPLRFDEGAIEVLDFLPGSLGGIVAWPSIIHSPPERLPVVFSELRVLAVGGHLLIAFQTGDEPRHSAQAYDHDVDLDAYRLPAAGRPYRGPARRLPTYRAELAHPGAGCLGEDSPGIPDRPKDLAPRGPRDAH